MENVHKQDFKPLLEATKLLAEKVGLGEYFGHIMDEIRDKDRKFQYEQSQLGVMKKILDSWHASKQTNNDEVIIVEARTGIERKTYHAWANFHGYKHCVYQTDMFHENRVYRCKECNHTYYRDEMNVQEDWGMTTGSYYGQIIKCRECDSCMSTDDPDPDYDDVKCLGSGSNSVMIGAKLPILSKRETRKHKKKKERKESPTDINLLQTFGLRQHKILSLASFTDTLKQYTRTVDPN